MSLLCDCGARVADDEDRRRCAQRGHRDSLIALTREALNSTPAAFRGDDWHAAMADLDRMEDKTMYHVAVLPEPQLATLDELVGWISDAIALMNDATGRKPKRLLCGPRFAAAIRDLAAQLEVAFPDALSVEHARPLSHADPDGAYVGSVAGVAIYEALESATAPATSRRS